MVYSYFIAISVWPSLIVPETIHWHSISMMNYPNESEKSIRMAMLSQTHDITFPTSYFGTKHGTSVDKSNYERTKV